jgi:moderate conductance mechanosensitive channel
MERGWNGDGTGRTWARHYDRLVATDTPAFCDTSGWACDPVYSATGNETLARAVGWLSDKPLKIALILGVAWILNRVLRTLIKRAGERMASNADRLGGFMPSTLRRSELSGRSEARAATISTITRSIATAIVVLFASTAVLSVLGVSLTALLASAGVVGVALGFGAQNLVRDVLAGWFILIEDRYGVGDLIDAGPPAVGTVERVTLRSTRLRDQNGTVWHVANGEILRVGNKSQSWSQAVVDVVVSPDADVDRACEVLGRVGHELREDPGWSDRVTAEPDVLGVHLMDAAGVTLRVVCKTEPASQFPVEREYRLRVLRAFDAEHIPLATMERAMRQLGGPVGGAAAGDPPPG